ncbi:Gfo/Idh/MocA family protein [Microbacterium album]|uniref:Dehydrogenase n=1 Tax=Microbacterium album TaxID=2053191 RepID=A0A917IBH6_9MICO|nr:Gfo/Idh/MocA family oxidoreductase [Microbacterium album]GGH35572.1 dehydrogenase [Microbacterium album]
MRKPIRSGIIGTGFMGTVHTRAVRAAGGVVTAYAGRDPGRTAAAAEAAGVELALTPAELIAHPDVDVVHVCTPNAQHVELAAAAIAAGKHVVCEKPLALSAAEARTLLTAAEAAGVVHAVPFVYRYYPVVREARARIGEAGERIWLAHGHYLQDWLAARHSFNWRIDEGESRAFADIGVHWCDLLEFTTGHRISRLSAISSQLHESRLAEGAEVPVASEDGVTMLFETDRGATGSVVISQASPGRKNRLWLSLDGERFSYSFDQENPDRLWVGSIEDVSVTPKGAETTRAASAVAPYVTVPSGHPQGYQDCFTLFMSEVHSAVRGQPIEGMPTFADGVRAAALTEAVVSSADSASWVQVGATEPVGRL